MVLELGAIYPKRVKWLCSGSDSKLIYMYVVHLKNMVGVIWFFKMSKIGNIIKKLKNHCTAKSKTMCHKCQLLDTYKHREGCPAKTGVNFYQQIQRKKPGISFHNRSWKKNLRKLRIRRKLLLFFFIYVVYVFGQHLKVLLWRIL